jgi:hypothetical protein
MGILVCSSVMSTGSDQDGVTFAVSYGAWILIVESPTKAIQWQLSHDVPGPAAKSANLHLPRNPTSLQLLDAIRSVDADAPSVELVRQFIQNYPGFVDGTV